MPFPVILISSLSGSDTQASGAGPTTAVFGTGASLASSTSVNLSADSPDLSGVATDGSACLWVLTSSGRQYSRITAVDNGTKVVTVATTYSVTEGSRTWAIGGKRASIGSTNSRILFERASSTGDIQAGWIVEMESGHTETITSTFNFRCDGDITNGPIILRGTYGAVTKPILTFSNNGNCFTFPTSCTYTQWRDFEMRNNNAGKTASIAFSFNTASNFNVLVIENIVCTHSTDRFWKFLSLGAGGNFLGSILAGCYIKNCADTAVDFTGGNTGFHKIINNIFKSNGGNGIRTNQCDDMQLIAGNIFANNTGAGLRLRYRQNLTIKNNTFDSNSGAGLHLELDSESQRICLIFNNIFSNNGTYGADYFDGGAQAKVSAFILRMNNCYYNNTSGKYNLTSLTADPGESILNPSFTNASNDDYSIGSNLKAMGYPSLVAGSNTDTSIDIGAYQAGASVSPIAGNFRGGFVN